MVNMIPKKCKGMPSQLCSTQICDSSKEEKEREKELKKEGEKKIAFLRHTLAASRVKGWKSCTVGNPLRETESKGAFQDAIGFFSSC